MTLIDTEQLKQILPNNKNIVQLTNILNNELTKYNINTKNRIAGFLGQCAVESMEFNVLEENLNYGSQGLMSTWPSLFPTEQLADQFARQPEKIANHVYANKLGNGPESSGDGWKYRGRGAIQITGKSEYSHFAQFVNMTTDQAVEYVKTLEGAIVSACYYWHSRNINGAADMDDIRKMTMLVNGPRLLGLDKRTSYYNKAKSVL